MSTSDGPKKTVEAKNTSVEERNPASPESGQEPGYGQRKLDSIDLEIIRNLWDGRTPYRDVAKKIGLTTNTVRNRVNRMLEEGNLQIISLVHPSAISGHTAACICIKAFPKKINSILEQITQLKGVVGASTVTGRFDILAVVMFNEEYTYERFMYEELQQLSGIVSSETFFIVSGKTFQLRYVL
jgi:Lrp/AsnC family transcriptional regulator, regulator for asnA, asnC and gidA